MSIHENSVTVSGNLLFDPELKYTPNGKAVVNIKIAVTPRFFNKKTNQFEEKETQYFYTTLWEFQAEEVAKTYKSGDRVMISGDIVLKVDQGKDDKIYPKMFLENADIALVTRRFPPRNSSSGNNQRNQNGNNISQQNNYNNGFNGGNNSAPLDEPPF